MSSRQLRKLQRRKQRELELEQKIGSGPQASDMEEEGGQQTDEDARAPAPKPRVNLFAAFGGDEDDSGKESAGGGGDHDTAEETRQEAQPEDDEEVEEEEAPEAVEPTPSQNKNKSKKKKGKKGKKGKGKTTAKVVDKARSSDDGGEEEDEIDRALQELGLAPKRDETSPATTTQSSNPRPTRNFNEILKVSSHDLKVVHEMRNLFGRDVIESANAENAEDEQDMHRRGRHRMQHVDLETFLKEPPWAKKLPEISLRRNVFIQGREHWPRATAGGLTMTVVGAAADGQATEYTYAYDKTYDETQVLFFALVQMGDPMQMVNHLKQHPYHVSLLLQVSSVAQQDQNMALAAELCERALFTFGRMTTSAFRKDVENGRARLNFNRPENRQFWLAGHHYIRSLIRKGTYRTALEWAKLLFAVDPQDPYAMRHLLHFLAIRAHESSWLLAFLDRLPDMSGAGDTIYLQQTRVLALLQKGDAAQARSSLARGMQQLPWLYCALFQDLGLDAPRSIWGIGADANSDARAFWVKLYLHRAKDLWNYPAAIALLKDVAGGLERVDVGALPADDPPVDRGSVRLAFLEGATGLMGLAPREILESQPNYEFDPLPPPEDENIFSSPATKAAWSRGTRERDGGAGAHLNLIRADLERLVAAHENMRRGLPRHGAVGLLEGQDEWPEDEDEAGALEAALRESMETAGAAAGATVAAAGPEARAAGESEGLMAGLMRMLGMGPRRAVEEGTGEEGEGPQGREYLPGAWPEMEAGVYDYDEEDEAYDMRSSSESSQEE